MTRTKKPVRFFRKPTWGAAPVKDGSLRTSEQTAKLLILNVEAYARQRDKDVSRVTLTPQTIARFANRRYLDSAFMVELEDCLAEYGWQMFETFVGNARRYAMIRLDTTAWVCISDTPLFPNGVDKASQEDLTKAYEDFGERGFMEDDLDEEVA